MIEPAHPSLSIVQQCGLLGLNRSSYYRQPSSLSPYDLEVLRAMDEIFTEHPYYGTRRMKHVLRQKGYKLGRKKIRRYYQILGLEALYPKMNLSKRNQAHKIYPYLLKNKVIDKPNQVWSSDITYIRLKQGFVYLCAIMDWYSRYVLSWRVSISLETEFCVLALREALHTYGVPLIFNTDQGVQYTSRDFINVLESHSIAISMDGKGRALDNVFIERFWRSIKQEKIYLLDLQAVKEAEHAIKEYMSFYNDRRPHQSLGYQTPAQIYGDKKEQAGDRMEKPFDLPTYPQLQQQQPLNKFIGFLKKRLYLS